jgi:hypothetical protein
LCVAIDRLSSVSKLFSTDKKGKRMAKNGLLLLLGIGAVTQVMAYEGPGSDQTIEWGECPPNQVNQAQLFKFAKLYTWFSSLLNLHLSLYESTLIFNLTFFKQFTININISLS